MTLTGSAPELARVDASGQPWWRAPFRVFQTNLRETDAGLDVEATLDAIEAHGSNAWLINAGGIVSFYPTELDFQTPNPHLAERASGDLLGDAVAAAHRRGIRVIARMDFSKLDAAIAGRHPEWLYVDSAGKHQEFQGLYSTCPAADYYQEASFAALTEVAHRYPVDGFFFNWFGFNELDYAGRYRGVCQNDACRHRFAAWSEGSELPVGPDSRGYVAWRRFAGELIADLTGRFRDHIGQLLPGAAFIRGPGADIVFHEANNEIGRTLWASATSESVSAIRTADPRRPVFVNSVAFVDMPYRLAAEEPARYEQYIAQTLARGGNPSVYIMGAPGAIDYPNVSAVAPLFRFHRDNAAEYTGLVPAAQVALVQPDPLRPQAQAVRAEGEFRGIYRALQQRQVPFDVLPAAALLEPAADLPRYAVVVLADAGELRPAAVAQLDAAVAAGTSVVLTGSSAATGPALAATPVASYGQELTQRELYATYAVGEGDPGQHPRHPAVPIYGAWRPIQLHADATGLLQVVPPAPYGPPEKAHGSVVSSDPAAAIRRQAGAGSVVVIPWTVGRSFHDLGLAVCRDLIVKTVADLLPPDRLRFDLPPHVEATVMARGSSTLIHLVNLSGVQGNGFTEPLPVRGGRIVTASPVVARDLLSRETLATQSDASSGGCVVGLPEFGTLAVVRLDPLPAAQPEGTPAS